MAKGFLKGFLLIASILLLLLVVGFIYALMHTVPKPNILINVFCFIGVWQFFILIPWAIKKHKRNKQDEGKGILLSSLLGILILILNWNVLFSFNWISLETLSSEEIRFYELESLVQSEWLSLVRSNPNADYKSINQNTKSSYYITTMDDGFWTLATQGFKHHFIINDQHYTLQANRGKPFILHENQLIFPDELNQSSRNLSEATFIKFNLE